ncbi:hypothetical protein [Leifsonia sp. 2MCAF36]|uniref:hypothetical protein n=1 Tax=Leifsonia sp. 2MCAF36 TaxID=3232988 RepID=UPI003F9E5B46
MSTKPPRNTLAKRLGDRLNSIPLSPAEDPPVDQSLKKLPRRTSVLLALMGVLMIAIPTVPVTLNSIWWGTKTTRTCQITEGHYYATNGKGGPGWVYEIATRQCGQLQVTSGPTKSLAETKRLGDSLLIGHTYRFELRGWSGLLSAKPAIMSATLHE